MADCIKRHGATPTVYLNRLGMFEHGGGGFHCVHMTEEDLDICLSGGLWVITNPSSNLKLASGIAASDTHASQRNPACHRNGWTGK